MIILTVAGLILAVGFAIGAFIINNDEKKHGRRD